MQRLTSYVRRLTVEGVAGVGAVIDGDDDDATRLAEARRAPARVAEAVRARLCLRLFRLESLQRSGARAGGR